MASYLPHLLLLGLITGLLGCSPGAGPVRSTEVAAKGVHTAAIADDGRYTIIGSIHHGGSLWRNASAERLYNWNHKQGEYTTLVAADFSPDGDWALTADVHTLVLWNMQDGSALRYWTAPGEVLSVALGRNGNYALLGLSDHTAVVFDVKRGGVLRTFGHGNRVRSVDLSEDGRFALTGSEDGTAVLWSMSTGQPLHTLRHNDEVQLVRLSRDGSLALSAAKYDKAVVWQTSDGSLRGEIPLAAESLKRGLRFTAAAFSDDNQYLLTGRPDQTVQLWRLHNLTLANTWQAPKRDAWKPTGAAINAVAFSGQGYLAVASNGFVHEFRR